jgi:gas vesicle protein
MTLGKAMLGVLAGVAAGALLGVLFAPEKGTNTRRKLSKKGEDILDDLQDKFDEFVETVTEKMDNLSEDADEMDQKVSRKYKKAMRETEMN